MKQIFIISILVGLLLLTSCSKDSDVESATNNDESMAEVSGEEQEEVNNDSGEEAANTSEEEATSSSNEPLEEEVFMAPDFTLMSSKGEEISLSDYRGKIVFVNFFTTWCKYCVIEMPEFQKAVEKYGDDLVILLVDVTTDGNELPVDEVIEWYEAFDYTMPMVLDVDGDLLGDYPISAYPTTYFVDRDGSMIAYYPGGMTEEFIDSFMEEYK